MAKGVTSKSRNKDEENKRREEQQKPHSEQKQTTQKQKPGQSKPQNETPVESKPATQEVAPKPTSTQIPTLEPKYASPEQIEEARDFGRRSLEMARAGQLDMSEKIPFTQGVEGYAEEYRIPELEDYQDTASYAPETRQNRAEQPSYGTSERDYMMQQNAARNEQRRAERQPVDILGSRLEAGQSAGMDKYSEKMRPESSFDVSTLSEKDARRFEKLNNSIARISSRMARNGGSVEDQRALSALQAEKAKIMGQNLVSDEANADDVISEWLDPDYKMGRSEVEQAKQIIQDYENNEYKNSNIYDLTDEESAKLSQINALRDKVSKAESAIYGMENATINPLMVAADRDFYGWTVDDLRDEVARQRDLPMSPEVRAYVNQLQGEIDALQSQLDNADTVYSTGDAGVDEVIGSNTQSRNAAELRRDIEDKQAQMYKLMLEESRGNNKPNYDSYSLRKANAQKQNPVPYLAGDMGTRMLESMAIQGAMGSNGWLADMATDALTDTLPEYEANLAGGTSRKDAGNQALISAALNTAMDTGAWAASNADDIASMFARSARENADNVIPAVARTQDEVIENAARQADEIPTMDPAELAKQNEIDVNAKVDNVNQAVDEINKLDEEVPDVPDNTRLTDEEVEALQRGIERNAAEEAAMNEVAGFEAERQQIFKEIDDATARGEDPSMYYGMLNDLEEDMRSAHPELFDAKTSEYVGMPNESNVVSAPEVKAEAPTTQTESKPFSIEGTNLEWLKNDIDTLTMPDDVRADLKKKYRQFEELYRQIDNAQTNEELMDIFSKEEPLIEEIRKALQDNAGYPVAQAGRYDEITRPFIEVLEGKRINVPDNVRSELPEKTIRELNKHFEFYERSADGKTKEYLNFKLAKNGGVPIDTVFADIDNATSHALSSFMERQGLDPGVTENQILGLIQYADYLKSDYFKNTQTLIGYDSSGFRDLAKEFIDKGQRQAEKIYAQSARNAVDTVANEAANAVPASAVTNNAPNPTSAVGGGNVPPNTPPNGGGNPPGPNNNVIDLDQTANGDVFERGTSKHITADPYEFDPHNYNGSYTINNNGKIELTFKDMPDNATRKTLKQNGFKWDSNNKVWTAEATPENKSLARKISRTPTENGPTGSYTINNKKEIEISFGKAPNEQTIKEMKARGFKYDPRAKTWYAKDTAYRRELADSIMTGNPIPRKTGMMRMEGVSDEVVDTFRENPDMYNALRNEDTKALADAIYNSGDTTVRINNREYSGNAEAKFRELLREKNPASLPLGHQIAKDYSAAGNHDMAAQIYHEMGQALTESGQFSQAAIINMVKNDPMTALQYFQKQINSMNIEGAEKYGRRWKDFILTDEEKALFDNIKPGDEEAIKKAMDAVGARIEKEYPVTLLEQLLEFRRVAMLFNSRTLSRNFLANPPTAGMRYVADRIEAIGQNIAHLINPEIEVTQAILGSNRKTRGIAEQLWGSDKVQNMFKDTSGRLSEVPKVGDYVKNRQIFKGDPVSKWINRMTNGGVERLNARLGKERAESLLEAWRNGAYKAMEVTDKPLVKENFVSRLGSYIKAKGITDPSMVPDEAIMMAWEEAMKATYKDNSWLVDAIRKLKGGIESFGNGVKPGLGDIASQALIPYVQAPGNIGARVLDYSPVGLGKGIGKMWDGRRGLSNIIKGASRESYNPQLIQKGIEEFSKGASGTLLTGLGMMLYKSGLLTGGYSDDADEKAFQKQHGYREYALRYNINGETKYDTIDWAQPFSDVIIMGALLQEAIDKSDEYDSDILRHFGYEGTTAGRLIGTARESAGHAINAYFDATPLKNLGELFKGNYNGETDIAGNLWQNTVEDFASGLVPAQLNAIAKTTDSTQRQTYDPSNKFSTFVNTIEAKMPWSSNDLPAKYDTLGRPMTNGNSKAEAGFAKLLYPGEHTSDKSEAIDREISRLFNATQEDRSVFPLVAPNSVNGEKLTAQEVSDYQGDMGARTRKVCEALMDTDLYQSLDAVDQADMFKTVYGISKAITERDLFGKGVSDTSQYKGAIAAYDKGKEEGLLNYLQGSALITASGVSSDSNAAKAIRAAADKGDIEEAKALSENLSQLVNAGVSTRGQSAYAERGINFLGNIDPAEYANLWNTINADNTPESPNESVTQTEMLDYFNAHPEVFNNQTTAMQYWLGMLSEYDDNKKVPYYDSSVRQWQAHSRTGAETTLINNLTEKANNGTLEIPVVEQQTAQAPQPQQTEESASSTRLEPIYLTPDPKQAVQQIEASGVPVNYLDSAWAKASAANPNLTAQDFTNTWSAIDSDGNGTHSTSEFINYLNRMGYNQKAAEPILEAYWHNNWHDPRYINGKWSY